MKNKSELLVSREIFSEDVLRMAVQAYNGLGDIQIAPNLHSWVVTFQNCQYDAEVTKEEFSNYLINLASVTL